MKIRCPQCKRLFDYDPSAGPAKCPHEDCGWEYGQEEKELTGLAGAVHSRALPAMIEPAPSPALAGDRPLPQAVANRLPAGRILRRSTAPTGTVRCPACRSIVPETAAVCPECNADLEAAFGEKEGVRAVFDVSGDITFTPRMVAILFATTLAAFLAFTWIISNRGSEQKFVPLLLTTDSGQAASSQADKSLQGVTFSQLKKEFLDARSTDLRRDVLRQKFIGQRVIWSGTVKSVSAVQDGFNLEIIMEDVQANSFVSLAAISHPSNNRLIANLSRGQTVLFSGRIAAFDTGGPASAFDYFLIRLEDGIILK
ncbi:MAG TPA: hypothetical protein VJ417_05020 [Candidatus Glassbacteria bacterium]|nr:hypothetical protein [Candidatus Glassbacteria bacterium]